MKINKIYSAITIFVLVIVFSCKKEEKTISHHVEGMMQLKQKLPNPYSKESMLKAYDNLMKKIKTTSNPNGRIELYDYPTTTQEMQAILVATNKYIRVLPANEEQYNRLRDLSYVTCFDFPLDYELMEGGNYYHDPTLLDSQITWQYIVLKNNEDIPLSIGTRQVLETDIFLPENSVSYSNYSTTFWEYLEDEALALYGFNTGEGNQRTTANAQTTGKWTPRGRIMVLDQQPNQIVPMEGVKVMMKKFWRHGWDFTDANGYYESNKELRGGVDFSIKWERDHATNKWDIRSGFYGQAWTDGPNNRTSNWDRTLGTEDINLFYATIYRATFDVLAKDPFGLSKPATRLKIAAMDESGTGVNHHIASIVAGPDIKIFRKNDGGSINHTTIIYGTTAHEIGHSIHRSLDVTKFAFCSSLIRESWAECVEWAFCNWKYNTNNLYTTNTSLFKWFGARPGLFITSENNKGIPYTPLFIDLIDNISNNSNLYNNNFPIRSLNDNIGNYTLKQIENALASKGWIINVDNVLDDIRIFLITTYSNPSENNIQSYFSEYKPYNY